MRHQRIPKYRLHRATGQAVVTILGRDHYLGRHSSSDSRKRYAGLINELLARGSIAPPAASNFTVAELIADYIAYAERHYAQRTYARQALERIRRSLSIVATHFAATQAAEFGPRMLKIVREKMVERKWSRSHVNQCVSVVVRAWRWAASDELVPGATLTALESVEPLRIGARGVIESEPRLDVEWDTVRRSLRWLSPTARAIVLVLWYTGARPSEILRMRIEEVDRRTDPWIYRPKEHKCRWRGHGREILLGRMAQRVLRRFMDKKSGPVFQYTVSGLRAVIRLAALKAGVPHWSPYQLRHAFITRLVDLQGEAMAAKLAGQRGVMTARRYTHQPLTVEDGEVMRRVG